MLLGLTELPNQPLQRAGASVAAIPLRPVPERPSRSAANGREYARRSNCSMGRESAS